MGYQGGGSMQVFHNHRRSLMCPSLAVTQLFGLPLVAIIFTCLCCTATITTTLAASTAVTTASENSMPTSSITGRLSSVSFHIWNLWMFCGKDIWSRISLGIWGRTDNLGRPIWWLKMQSLPSFVVKLFSIFYNVEILKIRMKSSFLFNITYFWYTARVNNWF